MAWVLRKSSHIAERDPLPRHYGLGGINANQHSSLFPVGLFEIQCLRLALSSDAAPQLTVFVEENRILSASHAFSFLGRSAIKPHLCTAQKKSLTGFAGNSANVASRAAEQSRRKQMDGMRLRHRSLSLLGALTRPGAAGEEQSRGEDSVSPGNNLF